MFDVFVLSGISVLRVTTTPERSYGYHIMTLCIYGRMRQTYDGAVVLYRRRGYYYQSILKLSSPLLCSVHLLLDGGQMIFRLMSFLLLNYTRKSSI